MDDFFDKFEKKIKTLYDVLGNRSTQIEYYDSCRRFHLFNMWKMHDPLLGKLIVYSCRKFPTDNAYIFRGTFMSKEKNFSKQELMEILAYGNYLTELDYVEISKKIDMEILRRL